VIWVLFTAGQLTERLYTGINRREIIHRGTQVTVHRWTNNCTSNRLEPFFHRRLIICRKVGINNTLFLHHKNVVVFHYKNDIQNTIVYTINT